MSRNVLIFGASFAVALASGVPTSTLAFQDGFFAGGAAGPGAGFGQGTGGFRSDGLGSLPNNEMPRPWGGRREGGGAREDHDGDGLSGMGGGNSFNSGCWNCGSMAAGAAANNAVNGSNMPIPGGGSTVNGSSWNWKNIAAGSAAAEAGAMIGQAAIAPFVPGSIVPSIPSNCSHRLVGASDYYVCNGTWYQPFFGNNAVSYRVVPPR